MHGHLWHNSQFSASVQFFSMVSPDTCFIELALCDHLPVGQLCTNYITRADWQSHLKWMVQLWCNGTSESQRTSTGLSLVCSDLTNQYSTYPVGPSSAMPQATIKILAPVSTTLLPSFCSPLGQCACPDPQLSPSLWSYEAWWFSLWMCKSYILLISCVFLS